jgi:hypothetical protein
MKIWAHLKTKTSDSNIYKERDLFCPCCEDKLELTHRDRYQDMSEHISNPNGYISTKDAYQCINKWCVAHNMGAVWIENGDFYVSPPNEVSSIVASKIIKKCSVIGTEHPKGSWMHNYELGKKLIKEKTKKIDIKKYRIVVSPLEKGYNYSEEDQYKPHTWKRKVEFWKRVDDNAYSLLFVFSWYHFKYRIKRTKEQIVNKFSKKC